MSRIEELAKLAAERDELLKERDAAISTAAWRIRQLEARVARLASRVQELEENEAQRS